MKEKVASLETEIALMRADINTIKQREPELPKWLRNSAIIVLGGMFTQIMSTVWWAASMTTNLENIKVDVSENTKFRIEYPQMHAETMISLKEIQTELKHQKSMLHEVKDKLRYVNIKTQHKEIKP